TITPLSHSQESTMAQAAVGMIGLGIMGSAMSHNLMRAGHPVVGYDVADPARKDHAKAGGKVAKSVAEVAAAAGTIITSLPSYQALAAVADELGAATDKRHVVIETSTMPIAVKEAARDAVARSGAVLLDCPLSGTGAQARAKDLLIYVSGDKKAYERV